MKFNNFDIIINSGNADTFWFHIFSKYSNNIFEENANERYTNTPYSEDNIKFHLINKNFIIRYNDYEIKIIFDKIYFDNVPVNQNKFYLISDYLYDFYNRFENCNQYGKIYYSIEEIPFANENKNLINEFLKMDNFSLITTTDLKFNSKNILYDYKISLIYFYYLLRFYHLPIDEMQVSKKYFIGSYYRKKYRPGRDYFFDKIKKITDVTTYSIDYDLDKSSIFDLKYQDGWYGNHITSYLDYLKSVCNIIVESEDSESINYQYHCTEKTLKAILFSKLNIFFIYYANHNLIKELISDGYWFLNFEFIDINNINEDSVNLSIEKTIQYLNQLKAQFNNYDLLHQHLIDKFGNKLQNNYKIFINLKESTYLSDIILDFIIYKFNKHKHKHIL
jgi:hypothetical protein